MQNGRIFCFVLSRAIWYLAASQLNIMGPFYWDGLPYIPTWISNYIYYEMWDEITYPLQPLKFDNG